MSIYSGFAKRSQETVYNKLVFKALDMLSQYVYCSRFNKPFADELKFSKKMLKLYKAMNYMEKNKHLEPNMSVAIHHLAKHLYYEYKEGSANITHMSSN